MSWRNFPDCLNSKIQSSYIYHLIQKIYNCSSSPESLNIFLNWTYGNSLIFICNKLVGYF